MGHLSHAHHTVYGARRNLLFYSVRSTPTHSMIASLAVDVATNAEEDREDSPPPWTRTMAAAFLFSRGARFSAALSCSMPRPVCEQATVVRREVWFGEHESKKLAYSSASCCLSLTIDERWASRNGATRDKIHSSRRAHKP